jgi:hypothetical protein
MSSQTFAFPKERKEPLNDARHVRNAIARFDQVEDVSDSERDAAWRRIRAAARKFGVEVKAKGWRSLMKGGKTESKTESKAESKTKRTGNKPARRTRA